MKGVILAGGLGTRLHPLTGVTNKHLLPIYDRPMIYYPIQCLINAGLREIIIVTGGEHAGDFLKLLGNGKKLGIRELHYTYQEGEGGIADALLLAEDFADLLRRTIVGENAGEDNERAMIVSWAQRMPNGEERIRTLLRQDIHVEPDPRTNSLLVMAPSDSIDMLEALIRDFDAIRPIRSEIRLFPLINSDAQAMADQLAELFDREGGGGEGDPPSSTLPDTAQMRYGRRELYPLVTRGLEGKGFGTPENAVSAGIGSLFQRLDGGANTTLYVKESGTGASGWTAK
ncbi:MAG: NTP transferase domain-containing protein [Planctomycetes bacterium]|nr:NTP transferase domain-containing protein [Planctomycetota bacterium]